MREAAWFQCHAGCPGRFGLTEVLYRCRRCGGLLEVEHDLAALRRRGPVEWIQTFDARHNRSPFPYGSGVWAKLEWVLPELDPSRVVSLGEGNSSLLRTERYGAAIGLEALWVKQCGTSHTGSFKDLGMTVLVSAVRQAIAEGRPIRALACASTGDTSAALAAYGAAAAIPVVVLLPAGKISPAQLVQPIAHGALVGSLDTDFDGCMRVVQRLTEDPGIYLANSMNSLRIEGQKTAAIELVQQLGWEVPDWVLVPGGNLGNVSALARGFEMMRGLGLTTRLPRLVCCQAAHASPLFQAFARAQAAGRPLREEDYAPVVARATLASAIQIGAPVSLPKAIRALVACEGLVEAASEAELADAAALADRSGLFTCPHTGVALACLQKLVARGTIGRRDRVVVISTAHGLKFTEFKAGYHAGSLGLPGLHRNQPVSLGREPEEVVAALHRALDRVR